jgi:hypothetical protein
MTQDHDVSVRPASKRRAMATLGTRAHWAIEALTRVAQKIGILHESLDEIREIGGYIVSSS